jgi:hypothetical protein
MKKCLLNLIFLLIISAGALAQTARTIGNSGADFPTLKDAFDAINGGTIQGNIRLRLITSVTEYSTAELFQSGYGSSNYASVLIYPATTGLTIDGDLDSLICLNGAANVTIDGRVDTTGSTISLVITNINTGTIASTIKFLESAQNNTVKYCTLKGSGTGSTSGIIYFSSASVGTGNNGNTVNNNNITSDAAGRPINAVYSLGTSGSENSGNTISNNNIYDFINPASSSNGIYISSNNTSWTIDANSFYETSSFNPTSAATYEVIQINSTTGSGFIITNNYIGSSSSSHTGTWTKNANTKSNVFYGVYLNVSASGTASSVQGNTISKYSWTNAATASNANWTGIHVQGGAVNIGTLTTNVVGAASGSTAISVTNGTTGKDVFGINIASTGLVDCENNTIGYITTSNGSTNATNIYGINKTLGGTVIISYNTITNLTAGSASSGNIQKVSGIFSSGSGTLTINNNTIITLTNSTTNTTAGNNGFVNGITSSAGTNTISNNTIHGLTIANANNASNQAASVTGLALTGTSAVKTITGNTIYDLSNTYTSFTGSIIGIYFYGNTGTNVVSANFIYSLSVNASSTSAFIFGINIGAGAATYSNNIITLGGNTATTIYGIYEPGTTGNTSNIYFNTVYIEGSLGSGISNTSYALFCNGNSSTRDFRNNILVNARSTSGGSNRHYALFIASSGGTITCDYNNYYVSGTGGTLGYYGNYRTSVPIVDAPQDGNSSSSNPTFTVSPPGTTATDYKPTSTLSGVSIFGITIDYSSASRGSTPTVGAWEMTVNKWKGGTSTDWANTANWTGGTVPGADANIIFDDSPSRNLYLDGNRSVTNITNAQGTYNLYTNGNTLTVKGSLIFSNSAKINASSGTVEFAGTSTQDLPSGAFVSDQVNNLTINNVNNVTFNGTLNILGTLTTTQGQLNAFANSPTLVINGTSAQSIGATQLASNRVYNLTIDNSAGVTLNPDLTVDNALTLTSGTLTLSSSKTLTLKGSLNRTSGAIDAQATGSTLTFAGTSAQSIPASAFVSDKVYNLTVNNSNNVTFSGTLKLVNNLTTTSGRLDASTNNPTFTFNGASAQALDAAKFVSNKAYNLTIDNSAGVTQNSDFTVDNNMTISTGSYTISAPRLLTVTGTITNSVGITGLVIKSSSNGSDGKLINNSSVGATVEMSYSGGTNGSARIYHYFVPPVANMNFNNTDNGTAASSLGLSWFSGDLLNYNESDAGADQDLGWNYFDGYQLPPRTNTTAFSTLTSSMGYNIHSNQNDRITFKGTLNGGTSHTFSGLTCTNQGWNLVGNPFPCNYNLTGISELTTTDNVDNTIYFNHDGDYAFWNVELHTGSSGFSDTIAPMQGFFVNVSATSSITLPASSKTSKTAVPSRSKGYLMVKKLKMVLNNGEKPDETIVCLLDNATSGFDGDYDAYKLFGGGDNTPFIYTELNSVQYALNAIKDPGTTTAVIPVTVELQTPGTYKIDITEFENLEGYTVILKHGSDNTILSKDASYSFISPAGTFTNFQLIIGSVITDVENTPQEKLKTWYSNNFLYINCPDEMPSGKFSIAIYDIQGKQVYTNNLVYLSAGQRIQLPLSLPRGVYITRISMMRQSYISKIVVF